MDPSLVVVRFWSLLRSNNDIRILALTETGKLFEVNFNWAKDSERMRTSFVWALSNLLKHPPADHEAATEEQIKEHVGEDMEVVLEWVPQAPWTIPSSGYGIGTDA